jgi:hypothetical protein
VAAPPPRPAPADAEDPSGRASGEPSDTTLQIGGLLGVAMPLNRRTDQVGSLAGPSLAVGVVFRQIGLWLDLESVANRDASHGTALLSTSLMTEVSPKLRIGGRLGIGPTLVNFRDPVFGDVTGTTVRVEAMAEYQLGASWALWLRPLSFDTLSAAALGGPIVTWQIRVGIAYRRAVGRHAAAPAPRADEPVASAPAPGIPPRGGAYPPPTPYAPVAGQPDPPPSASSAAQPSRSR